MVVAITVLVAGCANGDNPDSYACDVGLEVSQDFLDGNFERAAGQAARLHEAATRANDPDIRQTHEAFAQMLEHGEPAAVILSGAVQDMNNACIRAGYG